MRGSGGAGEGLPLCEEGSVCPLYWVHVMHVMFMHAIAEGCSFSLKLDVQLGKSLLTFSNTLICPARKEYTFEFDVATDCQN